MPTTSLLSPRTAAPHDPCLLLGHVGEVDDESKAEARGRHDAEAQLHERVLARRQPHQRGPHGQLVAARQTQHDRVVGRITRTGTGTRTCTGTGTRAGIGTVGTNGSIVRLTVGEHERERHESVIGQRQSARDGRTARHHAELSEGGEREKGTHEAR